MPPSISVFAPGASRAARMRPTSAITSSGVFRRLARLCAWLADSGTSMTSAPLSRARSAPFRFGTRTETTRSGQGLRVRDQLGGVGELRQELRRNERADLDLALAGGVRGANPGLLALGRQHGADALQPVAQADFADDDAVRKARHADRSPVGRADRSVGIDATLDVPRNPARGISESPSFRNGTSPAIIRGVRDIDLKTLRLFVAVSDCRSMARAAEQEHIEPSAISKRIAQLEDDLGVELLVRGRRGVQTTPAGLALLEHARSVLFTMDRIVADAASFAGGVQGHVRLIATASAIAEALLDDIASFMREPDNEQHQGRHRGAPVARPRARGARRQRLARRVLGPGRLRGPRAPSPTGATGSRSPSTPATRSPAARRSASRRRSTSSTSACRRRRRCTRCCSAPPRSAGRTVTYRVVVSGFDAALRVVAANLGVSVVPLEVGRRAAVGADIALIPIDDAWAERRFAICFRDFEALPPASRRLVDASRRRARPRPVTRRRERGGTRHVDCRQRPRRRARVGRA